MAKKIKFDDETPILSGRRERKLKFIRDLIESNLKWIFAALIGITMISMGVYIFQTYQKHQLEKAFEALYLAEEFFGYEMVIDRFKGLHADEVAYIKMIESAIEKENIEEAQKLLDEFIQNYPKSFFRPYAMMILGGILENQKEWTKARTYYEEILNHDEYEYAWNRAAFRLCQILIEIGELVEARKFYNLLEENAQGQVWKEIIRSLSVKLNING